MCQWFFGEFIKFFYFAALIMLLSGIEMPVFFSRNAANDSKNPLPGDF